MLNTHTGVFLHKEGSSSNKTFYKMNVVSFNGSSNSTVTSHVENKHRTYEGEVTAEDEWLEAKFLFRNSKLLAKTSFDTNEMCIYI